MTNSTKYLIWIAIAIIAFVTVICFASEIQVWLMAKFTSILILIVAFVAGWLLGRFGGSRRRSTEAKNARNITQTQK